MNRVPVVPPANLPVSGNLYVMFWAALNFLILIAILILVFWYIRSKREYQKQFLSKLDSLISTLRKSDGE